MTDELSNNCKLWRHLPDCKMELTNGVTMRPMTSLLVSPALKIINFKHLSVSRYQIYTFSFTSISMFLNINCSDTNSVCSCGQIAQSRESVQHRGFEGSRRSNLSWVAQKRRLFRMYPSVVSVVDSSEDLVQRLKQDRNNQYDFH